MDLVFYRIYKLLKDDLALFFLTEGSESLKAILSRGLKAFTPGSTKEAKVDNRVRFLNKYAGTLPERAGEELENFKPLICKKIVWNSLGPQTDQHFNWMFVELVAAHGGAVLSADNMQKINTVSIFLNFHFVFLH